MISTDMLADFKTECVLLEKMRVLDGMGGTNTVWRDGIAFDAYFADDVSTESLIAEQQGVTSSYRVYVAKDLDIGYGDVFRRENDEKTYRVTRDPTDKRTPATSQMDLKLIIAQRWDLPT